MRAEFQFTHTPIVPPPFAPASREIGACVEFSGIVRELENGAPLAALDYEAYEPMALRELAALAASLAVEHPCEALYFIHRLGRVPVGEASMFIRIASRHRGPALAFCVAFIDRLKTDVPIWKRAV